MRVHGTSHVMSQRPARTGQPVSRLQLRRLPPLLCRAFRVHVSSHQHHSTTTTLPTALPPSTAFLQLPLSCARQLLDRATTDLTTDHCHCHLTAASLNRQPTAAHLLPHSKSSASLSDRIRIAQQASISQPNYQHNHHQHVWTRKTRPVSRRDHEGHQAHPRRSRSWPPSRCCRQGRRGHRCPSWRRRQEDQGSQRTQGCRARCSYPYNWREQDHRQRSCKFITATILSSTTNKFSARRRQRVADQGMLIGPDEQHAISNDNFRSYPPFCATLRVAFVSMGSFTRF